MMNVVKCTAAGRLVAMWALVVAGLLRWHPARAQYPSNDPTLNNPAAPIVVRPDTATVHKMSKKERHALAAADSAKRTERLFGLHVTRPQKAGLLALLPGCGQIYNHKYWKLPLVYGMIGGLGYGVLFEAKRFNEYRAARDLSALHPVDLPATYLLPASDFPYASRELSAANIATDLTFYRHYLDLFVLLSALGYSLQILDAVVDAQLRDFDVSEDLSLNWQPTFLPVPGQPLPALGLSLTLRTK